MQVEKESNAIAETSGDPNRTTLTASSTAITSAISGGVSLIHVGFDDWIGNGAGDSGGVWQLICAAGEQHQEYERKILYDVHLLFASCSICVRHNSGERP